MRTIAILLFVSCLAGTAAGQSNDGINRHSPHMLAYSSLPEDEKGEDVQKNFLTQTWRLGTVAFMNGTNRVTVPLLFDVYSNVLYFLNNGAIMEFSQPVKEFTIPVLVRSDTIVLLYRRGYPAIHKNTEETFYQVLAEGKFDLLKCKAKTIGLYKDREVPEAERDYSKELLYARLPNGNMILVKNDKDYLLKEMPEYAPAIQEICAREKLKLKNTAQLRTLFLALNE